MAHSWVGSGVDHGRDPVAAACTHRRCDPGFDGDLDAPHERLGDFEDAHRGQTNEDFARARSVHHSRGTSDSKTSDIAEFAEPLLRVRDPHIPLIREAPVCSLFSE